MLKDLYHSTATSHSISDFFFSKYALCDTSFTGAARKVTSHFEYLENLSRGLDVAWQPDRIDLTVHP